MANTGGVAGFGGFLSHPSQEQLCLQQRACKAPRAREQESVEGNHVVLSRCSHSALNVLFSNLTRIIYFFLNVFPVSAHSAELHVCKLCLCSVYKEQIFPCKAAMPLLCPQIPTSTPRMLSATTCGSLPALGHPVRLS